MEPTRRFVLDPITDAVKTMMEQGVSKETITAVLQISDTELQKQLNYLYSRTFDISNKNWVNNPEHNRMFIKIQQQYMNDRLRAVGHLFLNEVYDMLGFPRSAQGQLVGWFRKPYSNFIEIEFVDDAPDFGFVLMFNPDGVIYNQLPTF